MKKQLFFNFYVTHDNFDCIINNIHYACLEHYKHVFDEAFINISVDNTEDYELISMAQNKFLSIFNGTLQQITFKVVKNDPFMREANFFHDEIIDKLGERDLVFFGHNKGLTNINSTSVDKESLFHWLVALYYASLEFPEKVLNGLLCCDNLVYGSCPTRVNNEYYYYSGSFYWMNCKRIQGYMGIYNIPKFNKTDRCGAEKFPNYIHKYFVPLQISEWMWVCGHIDYNLIINGDYEAGNWYKYAKGFCGTIGYLTENFYNLYNKVIKEEYFL